MPIEQTIYPLDRLVTGVASGTLTLPDMAKFVQDIIHARLRHYRKLIDVTHSTPGFSRDELSTFAQVLDAIPTDRQRGPLAIVANPQMGEFAHIFAALGVDGPPAKVFRSIHEARAWLLKVPVRDE